MKKSKGSSPSIHSGISPWTMVHSSCSTSVNCSVIPTCETRMLLIRWRTIRTTHESHKRTKIDRILFLSFDLDMISTFGWTWIFGQALVKYTAFPFTWPSLKKAYLYMKFQTSVVQKYNFLQNLEYDPNNLKRLWLQEILNRKFNLFPWSYEIWSKSEQVESNYGKTR